MIVEQKALSKWKNVVWLLYERRIKKVSFYTVSWLITLKNFRFSDFYMAVIQKNEKDIRIFHLSLVA